MLSSSYLDAVMLTDDKHTLHDGHVYLRRQYTVEIIQLEEVAPPSPHSMPSSSSSPSSSCSSESDEDEDEDCSSYCSSDLPMEEEEEDSPQTKDTYVDDTYSTRMNRIHAWRESFTKEAGRAVASGVAYTASPQPSSWNEDPGASGSVVLTSRSVDGSAMYAPSQPKGRLSTFSLHSCPACDASFDTSQSLRHHGRGPLADEACRVAVEYDFE